MILYHHEHADGTGPFQKKWNEIPLFARIIHLADTIDIIGNNMGSGNNSWNFICQYLLKNRDGLFDSECVNAFFYAFTHSESFICLSDNSAVHEEDGHEGLNLLMVDDRIPAGAKFY